MKLVFFAIVGLVVQGVGLTAFIVVSRSSVAPLGKPVIIGVAGLAVCALLWEGVRKSKGLLALCVVPSACSVGARARRGIPLVGSNGISRLTE